MKRNWTVVNIEKEKSYGNECPMWGKIVSSLLSLLVGIVVFCGFDFLWQNIYVSSIAALIYWFVAYKMGCVGYVIGCKIKNFVAPSKLYVKDPSISDVLNLKFYWKFSCQLTGLVSGSLGIHIIIFEIILSIIKSAKGA